MNQNQKKPQVHFSRRAGHQLILDDQIAVYAAAASKWFTNYNESVLELGRFLDVAANGFQSFSAVFEESKLAKLFTEEPLGLWPVKKYRVPIAPSTDVFRRTTKPIELVPPVAADLSVSVEGSVHIPEDVDLSGRTVPELPRRIEQTHPNVLYWDGRNLYPIELITEQRRRRN